MVQTFGTLGRFAECAGSGDGLSKSRGESLASEEALFSDFQPSRARQNRPFGHSRPCIATATPVMPEPLRKLISKTGGKDPFCASANCLDTSHVCGVQESCSEGGLLEGVPLFSWAPLNVTRLRHLQHPRRAPAAVQLSIRFLLHITSASSSSHLASSRLISASHSHVDKCSQHDAHHAFPDFFFQTSLLKIDPSTAEVSAANRIFGNLHTLQHLLLTGERPANSAFSSNSGAEALLLLLLLQLGSGAAPVSSNRPPRSHSDRRYVHEIFLKIFLLSCSAKVRPWRRDDNSSHNDAI
jgi:hypothetical protein